MTRADHRFPGNNLIRNTLIGKKQPDPLAQLLVQLVARMGADASIVRTTSRPWASALFEGRRHVIDMHVDGEEAYERVAVFLDGLEEADWALTGHFVADICLDDCGENDKSGVDIALSALTIEDW